MEEVNLMNRHSENLLLQERRRQMETARRKMLGLGSNYDVKHQRQLERMYPHQYGPQASVASHHSPSSSSSDESDNEKHDSQEEENNTAGTSTNDEINASNLNTFTTTTTTTMEAKSTITTNNDASNVETVTTAAAPFINDVFKEQPSLSPCGVGMQFCRDAFNPYRYGTCDMCNRRVHQRCVGSISLCNTKCVVGCNGDYYISEPPPKPNESRCGLIDKALAQMKLDDRNYVFLEEKQLIDRGENEQFLRDRSDAMEKARNCKRYYHPIEFMCVQCDRVKAFCHKCFGWKIFICIQCNEDNGQKLPLVFVPFVLQRKNIWSRMYVMKRIKLMFRTEAKGYKKMFPCKMGSFLQMQKMAVELELRKALMCQRMCYNWRIRKL